MLNDLRKKSETLQENVRKTYNEASQKVETSINLEVKNIAKSYNSDDHSHPSYCLIRRKVNL